MNSNIDVLLWIVPRFGLWVLLSAIPMNMVINLDSEDDYKNRGKIAMLLFLIFFVIAPFCFGI